MIGALKTNRTHTNAWSGKPTESAASPCFPVGEAGPVESGMIVLNQWSRVAGRETSVKRRAG